MNNNGRYLAVCLLDEYFKNSSYANITIGKFLKSNNNADEREKHFAEELFYGVITNLSLIDRIISGLAKNKKGLPETVNNVLRSSIYQIVFLENIPAYAVCNEAVKIIKKSKYSGMAGLVNAILRNIMKNGWKQFIPSEEENGIEFLAVTYSHPKWMIKRWVDSFGYENTKKLCKFNNSSRSIYLRVNTLKSSNEELLEMLEAHGVEVSKVPGLPDCMKIINIPATIKISGILDSGYAYIQDISTMIVSYVINPQCNDTVIDCCAAPGGKLIHMAQLMDNSGKIVGGDLHKKRVDLMVGNILKYGVKNAVLEVGDALDWLGRYSNYADRVLLDAPCSGTGVIARKKDIKWYRCEKDIEELSDLQGKLLKKAGECLKNGGILVYSTCSLEHEENMGVVEKFLAENTDFHLCPIEPVIDYMRRFQSLEKGYININPFNDDSDGFFIAKLKKEN